MIIDDIITALGTVGYTFVKNGHGMNVARLVSYSVDDGGIAREEINLAYKGIDINGLLAALCDLGTLVLKGHGDPVASMASVNNTGYLIDIVVTK